MEKAGPVTTCISTRWRDFLDNPITEEELKAAVSKGACNKAPGRDGVYLEFFKVTWDSIKDDMLTLFNQMYFDGRFMEQQKHCIVVNLQKTDIPTTLADYRPSTFTEYRL